MSITYAFPTVIFTISFLTVSLTHVQRFQPQHLCYTLNNLKMSSTNYVETENNKKSKSKNEKNNLYIHAEFFPPLLLCVLIMDFRLLLSVCSIYVVNIFLL